VATLRDERSNVLTDRLVTWTSSNTALATVSASGLVTGVSPGGPLTITATSEAKSGTSSITVVPPVVTAITLSPAIAAVFVGAAADLTATVIDQNGVVLTDRVVTWTTSDVAVATVSPTGQVIGISVGTATITASSGGVVGRAMITVSVDPCVSNVTISPGQTLTGMLEATDCPLDDGSFVDLFKLTLPMNARVQIDLTSTAFDPYLLLFELLPDGSALAINADNDGGPGTDARIQQTLDSATTYLIGANSLLEGKTGPYQLSVQLVASGMAAARLRPEDALTAAAVARKVSSGRRRGGSR
jgi:hypothetical protein